MAATSTASCAQEAPAPMRNPTGYTLKINPDENRGTWEGWGCSFAWWPNMVGGKNYSELYADLFYTDKTVPFLDQKLPGLNFNILRYNVGGGGRGRDDKFENAVERKPDILSWARDIDGYWIDWGDKNPASPSWDWSRDAAQRAMMRAAIARGADKIEFFSNAPMWWMMDSKSSAGGRLQSWNKRDFAHYLASVVNHAQKNWGVKVDTVEPFNEPSAGWWGYPKNQEGANVSREEQADILALLREELDNNGLQKVGISASDENNVVQARETHEFFKGRDVQVEGKTVKVATLVDKVNVHSYSGLEPMRDNAARQRLRESVGKIRLWADEFGGNEGGGMKLAQTIMEDINFIRPTAWIYWQALEPGSAWGLVNGQEGKTAADLESGQPKWAYTKYYAFAQFTRFLRPGMEVIGSDDNNSIVAYDEKESQLTFITINYGNAQPIIYDLSNLKNVGRNAQLTQTHTDSSQRFATSQVGVVGKKITVQATPDTIYSMVVDNVKLN